MPVYMYLFPIYIYGKTLDSRIPRAVESLDFLPCHQLRMTVYSVPVNEELFYHYRYFNHPNCLMAEMLPLALRFCRVPWDAFMFGVSIDFHRSLSRARPQRAELMDPPRRGAAARCQALLAASPEGLSPEAAPSHAPDPARTRRDANGPETAPRQPQQVATSAAAFSAGTESGARSRARRGAGVEEREPPLG